MTYISEKDAFKADYPSLSREADIPVDNTEEKTTDPSPPEPEGPKPLEGGGYGGSNDVERSAPIDIPKKEEVKITVNEDTYHWE